MTKNKKLIKSELLKSNLSKFFNEFPDVESVTVHLSIDTNDDVLKQNSKVFLFSANVTFDSQTIKETNPAELHERSLLAQVSLHNFVVSSIYISELYQLMGTKITLKPDNYKDKINEIMVEKQALAMRAH